MLLYTTDLVRLTDWPLQLQKSVYNLHQYCKCLKLELNRNKIKIQVFKKDNKIKSYLTFSYGITRIDAFGFLIYLGIKLHYTITKNYTPYHTFSLNSLCIKILNFVYNNSKNLKTCFVKLLLKITKKIKTCL